MFKIMINKVEYFQKKKKKNRFSGNWEIRTNLVTEWRFFFIILYTNRVVFCIESLHNPKDLKNGLIIDEDGSKEWYLNGKYHREYGPAIEYSDGDKSWWLNGIYQEKIDFYMKNGLNGLNESLNEFIEEMKEDISKKYNINICIDNNKSQ